MTDAALRDLAVAYQKNPLVDKLTDRVLELIRQDPHEAGTRPCETCARVTAMTGRAFWCLKRALETDHAGTNLLSPTAGESIETGDLIYIGADGKAHPIIGDEERSRRRWVEQERARRSSPPP